MSAIMSLANPQIVFLLSYILVFKRILGGLVSVKSVKIGVGLTIWQPWEQVYSAEMQNVSTSSTTLSAFPSQVRTGKHRLPASQFALSSHPLSAGKLLKSKLLRRRTIALYTHFLRL